MLCIPAGTRVVRLNFSYSRSSKFASMQNDLSKVKHSEQSVIGSLVPSEYKAPSTSTMSSRSYNGLDDFMSRQGFVLMFVEELPSAQGNKVKCFVYRLKRNPRDRCTVEKRLIELERVTHKDHWETRLIHNPNASSLKVWFTPS